MSVRERAETFWNFQTVQTNGWVNVVEERKPEMKYASIEGYCKLSDGRQVACEITLDLKTLELEVIVKTNQILSGEINVR